MPKKFEAPLAALLSPRAADGSIDRDAVARNVDFVLSRGAKGVVIAGATAEYVALSEPERKTIVEEAAAAARGLGQLLCSVGAADLSVCVRLADHAFSAGADAVLLPTPHFYPHGREDLETFYSEAARAIEGPILLYNLPAFTSPIDTDLTVGLIESEPNIVGIKDSSGKLDTLRALTARPGLNAHPILGHDRALIDALEANCIESVISGLAGVIPEVIAAAFDARGGGATGQLGELRKLIDEFLDKLASVPFPASLKLTAQARGLFPARYSLPLSSEQERRAQEYERWFEGFWGRCEETVQAGAGRV